MDMEACVTLGMLSEPQAVPDAEAAAASKAAAKEEELLSQKLF